MGWLFGRKPHQGRKRRFDRYRVPAFINSWVGLSQCRIVLLLIGPSAIAILGALFLDIMAEKRAAIVGKARVIDGDTLHINHHRIRLNGIDAPESDQTCTDKSGGEWRCGHHATVALEHKIGWRTVSCRERGHDQYGRIFGDCEAAGESLNAWMVRQGWAVAYTRYSFRYVLDEIIARIAGRGIWFGDFAVPEDWRRDHRR